MYFAPQKRRNTDEKTGDHAVVADFSRSAVFSEGIAKERKLDIAGDKECTLKTE